MIIICSTIEYTKRCYEYCKEHSIDVEELDFTSEPRMIFVDDDYVISENDLTYIKIAFNCAIYDSLVEVMESIGVSSIFGF